MGKSRLVAEFVRTARAAWRHWSPIGECPAFGANTSYSVWREVWRTLLGIDDSATDEAQLADARGAARRRSIRRSLPRAPLLDAVLGMTIPDTDLTRDARLRSCARRRSRTCCRVPAGRAGDEPLVLVLEDCHWIDPLSRDLLEVLVRAAAALPVLFVLTYRPSAEPGGGLGLARLPQFARARAGRARRPRTPSS